MSRTQKTKQIIQLVLAITFIVISGFVIYKNFSENKVFFVPLNNSAAERQNVTTFEKAIKVLEDVRFKDLIKFGNWPVVPGEKGRSNPFIKL